MPYDPLFHHRRSIRLRGYDYTQPGAYFVTLCTWQRQCLFGEVVGGEMRLSRFGQVAAREWQNIPRHFPNVVLDEWVVMPNHIHGIIWIVDGSGVGAAPAAGPGEAFAATGSFGDDAGGGSPDCSGAWARANASPLPCAARSGRGEAFPPAHAPPSAGPPAGRAHRPPDPAAGNASPNGAFPPPPAPPSAGPPACASSDVGTTPGVRLGEAFAVAGSFGGGARGDPPDCPRASARANASPLQRANAVARGKADGREWPRGAPPGSLGAIVGNFKSVVARRINRMRHTRGGRVWQRGYWERITRDETALTRIRRYIRDNPRRWAEDGENPLGS